MITKISISGYKSIEKIELELGRINVFIGENGAGKSNILEAIALAGAAAAEKLDNEFLSSRGIRVTRSEYMRPAFPGSNSSTPVTLNVKSGKKEELFFNLLNDNSLYSKWQSTVTSPRLPLAAETFKNAIERYVEIVPPEKTEVEHIKDAEDLVSTLSAEIDSLLARLKELKTQGLDETKGVSIPFGGKNLEFKKLYNSFSIKNFDCMKRLQQFIIYSPENSFLRKFDSESQIEPLGINGEGLLKLLYFYAGQDQDKTLEKVKTSLKNLNWFADFNTVSAANEGHLVLKDKFLDENISDFDHKSANEGFFFLLFYFLLFNSALTPSFFAIDNIDASLNPKLCRQLIFELTNAANINDKQAILTTHNPAVLDGLNLDDDEQRLFVISRNIKGRTKVKRIFKPEIPSDVINPPKLSELFLRGMLGGLPKGF